jgi:hypothetical protein
VTGGRPAVAEGALFILGAAAMLGCWVVVLLEMLLLAFLGPLSTTTTLLLFLLGAVAPALAATGLFVHASRTVGAPVALRAAPVAALAIGIASLVVLGR